MVWWLIPAASTGLTALSAAPSIRAVARGRGAPGTWRQLWTLSLSAVGLVLTWLVWAKAC